MLRKVYVLVVLLCCLAYAQRAEAQARFGVRGGVTDDPDSVFFGGHIAFHPGALPNFRIEPSLELGLGDAEGFDILTLRFNLNFKYAIPVSHDAAFFPLFGPALYYVDFDDCVGDCEESDFGINLGFGFAISGFAIELALGVEDIPDVTLTLSYTF
jgi:hypothetical protein